MGAKAVMHDPYLGVHGSFYVLGVVMEVLMVIGMEYGGTRPDDLAAKENAHTVTDAFMREFMRRKLLRNSTGLIGYNLSDPNALALVREKRFHTKWAKFVQDAGEILEKGL